MSLELVRGRCVPCRGGEHTLTDQEIAELKPQVPNWVLVEKDDIKHLGKVFRFKNFAQALAFTNMVGELAESEGHHPSILTRRD